MKKHFYLNFWCWKITVFSRHKNCLDNPCYMGFSSLQYNKKFTLMNTNDMTILLLIRSMHSLSSDHDLSLLLQQIKSINFLLRFLIAIKCNREGKRVLCMKSFLFSSIFILFFFAIYLYNSNYCTTSWHELMRLCFRVHFVDVLFIFITKVYWTIFITFK